MPSVGARYICRACAKGSSSKLLPPTGSVWRRWWRTGTARKSIYGRLPPRKVFPRHFRRSGQLLPSIRSTCCGRWPLTGMRSADRFTSTSASSPLLLLLGLCRSRSDLLRHHVEDNPRSWWKMLRRFDFSDGSRRHSNCRPIGFVAHHERPHHAGELVGKSGDDRVERTACE